VLRSTALALTLAATLLAAGCARDGGDAEPTPRETAPSPSVSTSTSAPTTPTETAFAGTEIVVEVRDGKVRPPTRRVEVAEGSAVRLLITSDTADEVHVHGFDVVQELPAGQQATVEFTPDQPGLFEIETHETGLTLVQLEVR
jgi:plastocyanin domain-containing protein